MSRVLDGTTIAAEIKAEVAEEVKLLAGQGIKPVLAAVLVGPAGLPGALAIRLPKLLVQLGLAASGAEASRKLAEKAVKLDGETATNALIAIEKLPARFVVRLGKRAKAAVIA